MPGIPGKYRDPSYRALEAEWNEKLKASGLVDIERVGEFTDSKLKDHWIESSRKCQRGVSSGAAEWFRLCYEWLDIALWPSRRARFAWAALADGWTMSDLVRRFPVPVTRFKLKPVIDAQSRLMREYFSTQVAEEFS